MNAKYYRLPTFSFKNLCYYKKNINYFSFWENKFFYKAWLISRSTWSIVIIIILKLKSVERKIDIWIPALYCRSVINIIKKLNITITYYQTDELLNPCKKSLNKLLKYKSPDLFILVYNYPNYNTFKQTASLLEKSNTWIIEDSTQSMAPLKKTGNYGHFVIYSPYKFLPVTSGAILIVTKKIQNIELNDDTLKLFFKEIEEKFFENIYSRNGEFLIFIKWILKQILMKINLLPVPIVPHEIYSNVKDVKLENPKISYWNKFILKININFIESSKSKRKNNLNQIKSSLKDLSKNKIINSNFMNKVVEDLDINNSFPITIPIAFNSKYDSERIYSNLLKKGIEVNTWPDLPDEVIRTPKFYNSINSRLLIIQFPVHQLISFNKHKLNQIFSDI